jgi:hypothetical protein
VFDPEALAAIDEAFDGACEALHDTGQTEIALEIIVQRISSIGFASAARGVC